MSSEFVTYTDPVSGYKIRQYTQGPEKNTKLYFTTENFSTDDQYFFFNKQVAEDTPRALHQGHVNGTNALYRVHVESGEREVMAGPEYNGFAMDRFENYGVMTKGDIVCRLDAGTGEITEIGQLPKGGKITGHLTTSKDGTIVCSYKQENCIYALVTMDPKTGKSEIVFQSDYILGHTQVCPTDSDVIFFIHETGGDALQRMWMFNCKDRTARPYYVEQDNEWITHEVWSTDGENMFFMKLPHQIMMGSKDGHQFQCVARGDQLLHPGVSRDKKLLCADRISYWHNESPNHVYLFKEGCMDGILLAETGTPKDGSNPLHPSFNRAGTQVLFNRPMENGIAQVCLIDLKENGLL